MREDDVLAESQASEFQPTDNANGLDQHKVWTY